VNAPLVTGADVAGAERARREFLTCRLGAETYGIDILQVQEIREIDKVTRVPRVVPFLRGVINLRGAIVPVVDLGLMFGFPAALELEGASAIVLNVGQRLVGLVVAAVSDVIALADDEILPAPEMGERTIGAAIAGIGTRHGSETGDDASSILLLDVDYLMKRIREERL
jgi:purine-binding chemotaxis protein CheW